MDSETGAQADACASVEACSCFVLRVPGSKPKVAIFRVCLGIFGRKTRNRNHLIFQIAGKIVTFCLLLTEQVLLAFVIMSHALQTRASG